MRYQLLAERKREDSNLFELKRRGSGVVSFLCSVSLSNEEIDTIIASLQTRDFSDDHSGLSFMDRLSAKYLWGAKKIRRIERILGETSKSYAIFYRAVDRKGEGFIFLKTRNESPYYEQSCAFTDESVESCLNGISKGNETKDS